MKKFSYQIVSIFLLFVISGCSEFISESEDLKTNDELVLKSKKAPVPVYGEFSVWVDIPPTPVNGIITQTEYGVSKAPHPSHLGVTNLYNEEIIYMSANTGQVPWDQVDPWLAIAQIVFTAANGDKIFVEINYEI